MTPTAARKHVVIVGAGFAGMGCALDLVRSGKVRVTLLDRHNYHQFQPLRGVQLLDRSDAARIDWYGDEPESKAAAAAK